MKKKLLWIIGIAVVVVMAVVISALFLFGGEETAYETVCSDGYQGSAEEFIAALVGEQRSPGTEVSAYSIAKEKGYEKDLSTWIETLTGTPGKDPTAPAYTVACEQGYEGTLAMWLETLVPNPDQLGMSKDGTGKTDYMLACEYGFEGSFTEWMVSLANESIEK